MNPARFGSVSVAFALALVARGVPAPAKTDPGEFAVLRVKAEHGNAIAQYNLGLDYLQGRQGEPDLVEAFVWLTLASEAGSTGKALDMVLDSLTPNQLEEGKRRLEMLRATNPLIRPVTTKPVAKSPAQPEPPRTPPPAVVDPAKHLAEQLSSATSQSRRLSAELTSARQQLEEQHTALAMRDARINALEPAQAALNQAQAALAGQTKEISASRAELARSRTDVTTAREETGKLQVRLTELQAQLTAASATHANEVARLAAERDTLRQQLAAAESSRSTTAEAAQRLDTLNRELASARDEAQAAKKLAATTNDSFAKIAAEKRELESALAAAKSEEKQLESALATARTEAKQLRAMEAELVDVRRELASALTARDAADRQRAATEATATEAQTKAEADTRLVTVASAASATELETLRARLAAAERTAEQAQSDLARANELLAARSTPTRPPAAHREPAHALPAVSSTPALVTTPASAPAPRTHTIASGDTLSSISRRYYGTANRWQEILAANRDVLRDERSLVTGRTLRIP
jgi:LysM repeat protein